MSFYGPQRTWKHRLGTPTIIFDKTVNGQNAYLMYVKTADYATGSEKMVWELTYYGADGFLRIYQWQPKRVDTKNALRQANRLIARDN